MSNLSFFEFRSNQVRTATIDGEIVFCLGDVGTSMTVYQAKAAIDEGLGEGSNNLIPLQTAGGKQETMFTAESGLTFLLSRSRTELGKQLNRLIHSEILPSLRKTGKYQLASEVTQLEQVAALVIPQTYAQALLEAGKLAMEKEQLEKQIEESAPLVEYAKAVECSSDTIDFNSYAKMIGTGRTRLFRAMREAGVIMKNSTIPYQQFVDSGYFEISQEILPDGKLIPFATITGKGQLWLKKRLVDKANFEKQMINAIAGSVAQMGLADIDFDSN